MLEDSLIMVLLAFAWWSPVIVANKRGNRSGRAVVVFLTAIAPFTLGVTWIVAMTKALTRSERGQHAG
jgi:hypothetical protein